METRLSNFNDEQKAAIAVIRPACWDDMKPAEKKYHEGLYQAQRIKDRSAKTAATERARQNFMDETDEIIKPYLAKLGATGLFTENELERIPL